MRSLLFLSLLSFGCANGTASTTVPGELETTGKTVVTVNGNAITQDMLDAMLEQMPAQMRKQMEMLGQMVHRKVFKPIRREVEGRKDIEKRLSDRKKVRLDYDALTR